MKTYETKGKNGEKYYSSKHIITRLLLAAEEGIEILGEI